MTANGLLVVGNPKTVEEFVHETNIVVPFGVQPFVGIVEVEHGEAAMVEAAEIACPNEFFLALLAEVDAIAYMGVDGGVGEKALNGEVGNLAATKEVQHLKGMGG